MQFEIDADALDDLQRSMEAYGAGAGQLIDGILHGEGALLIREQIAMILPESGRRWKGKSRPARAAMPAAFKQDNGSLSVTIAARGTYGYLYFPDDGTNTQHHAGNQQFMQRGAEAAADKILELCTAKLAEGLGGE